MNETIITADARQLEEQPAQTQPLALIQGGRQVSILERSIEFALKSGASLDQLQQLMDMKERFDEKEGEKAFTEAMTKFKEDPPEILKDKLVGYENKDGSVTGYRHASLAAVCDAAIKGLAAVGISHKWETKQQPGLVGVSCVLTHRMGHSERVYLEAPADTSGKKNAIQSIASTVSYLQRYTLLSITGLATKDQDNDGADHKDPKPDWVDEYLAAINAAADLPLLMAAWQTAAGACRRKNERVAYDEIKLRVGARCEEMGITQEQWAAATKEKTA